MIELAPATAEHVRALLPRLRADDVSEIQAAGLTCKRALWRSWKGSHLRTAALVDGEIAAIWGCGGTLLGGVGRPWLLTAPACERVPLAFVQIGRDEARRMLAVHERLEGCVAAWHFRAIRTLALMGFRLGGEVVLPNDGRFLRFTMERG
jgi:hypothetical protein